MDLHAAFMVNSCQGKDAGLLFRLKYSIHQHTGIGCDTGLIIRIIFNLPKVNTVPCTCEAALSLSLTASRWLDRLAYIERITD